MYRGKIPPVAVPESSDAGRIVRSGAYLYWVTEAHWNNDTKNSKDNRRLVGRVTDDDSTKMWPNANYRKIFGDVVDSGSLTHQSLLGGGPDIAALRAASLMGIMTALMKAFPKEWPKLFALCVEWLDTEDCVSQEFAYWFYENYCGFYTAMEPANISRFYESIGNSQYQRDLYRETFYSEYRSRVLDGEIHKNGCDDKAIIGCDGTNHNHTCEDNELIGYGKAKDDSDKPIVGTMCFVDENTGVSMFADQFPGSLLDKSQVLFSLEKSIALGFKDLHMMFDRGFLTKPFILFFLELKKKYNITFSASCPANFAFVKDMVKKYSEELRTKDAYYIQVENVYGMKLNEIPTIDGIDISAKERKSLSMYLFYDEGRAAQERQAIQDKISAFQASLEQRKKYTESLVKAAAPYFKVEKTKKDPRTKRSFRLIRQNTVIQEELDRAGFFMTISNGTDTPEEEIRIVRLRDKSEKSIRRRKSFFGLDTPGTETYATFLGKMFVADVAQNIEEALEYYCKPYIKAKSSTTVRTTIAELHKYKISTNSDGSMRLAQGMTAEQKEIFKCLNLSSGDVEKYVRTLKWNTTPDIIHNAKEIKQIERAKRKEEKARQAKKSSKTKSK